MKNTVDRRSKILPSEQIKVFILKEIHQGNLAFETKLPSIETMTKTYKATYLEVQEALDSLIKDGSLRKSGRHYTVAFGHIPNVWLNQMMSVYDMVKLFGYEPNIEVLNVELVDASSLEHFPEVNALQVRRIFYGNQQPLFLVETYLPYQRFEPLREDLKTNKPHYPLFKAKLNLDIKRVNRKMQPVNFNVEVAHHLQTQPGSAGILTTNYLYDQHHQLFEYTKIYNSMERFRFTLES